MHPVPALPAARWTELAGVPTLLVVFDLPTLAPKMWQVRHDELAHTVCRQLGLPQPARLIANAIFGRGSGPVWSDGITCERRAAARQPPPPPANVSLQAEAQSCTSASLPTAAARAAAPGPLAGGELSLNVEQCKYNAWNTASKW